MIYHAEELVRQWVYAGADALEAASHIIPLWKDSVIITQEIQSFSPKMEEERQWREAVIQVNALLMTYADTVERVRNGVATNLKG
ncbi:MAG: hypothetical protein LUF89_06840 [Ruminococcus sp.]|nr:hypothetical protein [Ruminococcus sp.]